MWFPTPEELVDANVLTTSAPVIHASGGGESQSDRRLRADVAAAAARMNRGTPRAVDSLTTLERATASGLTLTQYYRVNAEHLDIARSRAAMTAGAPPPRLLGPRGRR